MSENNISEKIEQYMSGEMNEQEAATFEQQVKDDPDLAYEVRIHQLAVLGMRRKDKARLQEFRDNIKNSSTDAEDTPIVPIKSQRPKIIRRLLAIAAMLFLTFLAYFLLPKQIVSPMAATTKILIERGMSGDRNNGTTVPLTPYQQGIELFTDKKYEGAIKLFDQVIKEDADKRAAAKFLKADALYRLGKENEVRAILESIDEDSPLYDKARNVLKEYQ